MSWIAFILFSAILASASTLAEKKTLLREHALPFAATLAFVNALFSLPFIFFADWAHFTPGIMAAMYLASIAAAVAFLLLTKALRHMEVSVASSLLIFSPAIASILAFIVLGEALTRFQSAGIVLMIIGSYVLEARRGESVFEPFRTLWSSKYVHFILWALLLYAGTSLLDRFLLNGVGVQPVAYLGIMHLFLAVNFGLAMAWSGGGFPGTAAGFQSGGFWTFLVALLTVGYRLADTFAVQTAPAVGIVIALKRLSTLITTIVGGEIFHEHHIMRKSIACIIMLAGGFLLIR